MCSVVITIDTMTTTLRPILKPNKQQLESLESLEEVALKKIYLYVILDFVQSTQ